MKDKVSELREILNKKRTMEAKKQDDQDQESTKQKKDQPQDHPEESKDKALPEHTMSDDLTGLQEVIEELKKASEIQKDMYLRKVAEFENFKKRLEKEQSEQAKYVIEKTIEDLLPVLDSLEMTLTHVTDDKDPIGSGVRLILKQFISALEKHGIKQISGEGQKFDPHVQEAIGTEENKEIKSGHVVTVHRKGYVLNGKLIRAALVTVSK